MGGLLLGLIVFPLLRLCLRDTEQAKAEGRNLAMQILENTARLYGYSSLDEVEARLR